MKDHHLLQPLLPTTTAATAAVDVTSTINAFVDVNNDDDNENIKVITSNSKIILRLFLVVFVGILSIWANHEASKGFAIDIKNDATDSAAGHRFQLLLVSNDKATRLVLDTSKFVETLLYPNSSQPKKQVNHVTLRLSSRNLTHMVIVESFKEHDFVLHLSPSTLEGDANVDHAMLRAMQQGMARVWLYDNAPKPLVNGMVEYISSSLGLAGLGVVSDSSGSELPESDNFCCCWKDENPRTVARFLNYCEEHRMGFIQRLNQAMKGSWLDRKVDDALGMPAQHLCASYISQKYLLLQSLESGTTWLPSHVY